MSRGATLPKAGGVKTQSLIIDCDPGVDDALGLFLAFGSPALELLAVTTVGGNVPGVITARNARIMRQLAGREDVPVHAGADRPLVREPVGAGEFHGEGGIGDGGAARSLEPCCVGAVARDCVSPVERLSDTYDVLGVRSMPPSSLTKTMSFSFVPRRAGAPCGKMTFTCARVMDAGTGPPSTSAMSPRVSSPRRWLMGDATSL